MGVPDNRDVGMLGAINVTGKVGTRTDVMVVSLIEAPIMQGEKIDDRELI